jgi:endonuclease YncB( thermonuclease family)
MMPFKAIKGTFHVVGYSPDGDSVRFKADNDENWNLLRGRKVKLNSKAHAQLRIEAIDTLETHYKNEHQPKELADAATTYLFNLLGITNVVWNSTGSKVSSADDGTPGYVVSRTTERYGRPVSFVFSGEQSFDDGQRIFINNAIARKSVNFKMLSKGLAYPTFYDGMFYDLRELFAKESSKSRESKIGVWSEDKTNRYTAIESLSDITDKNVLLPKLFRRLTAYIKEYGSFDAEDFISKMEERSEKVLILSVLHFTHLDNLLSVNESGKIKFTKKPENLVFLG